jgi:hypothetical protein
VTTYNLFKDYSGTVAGLDIQYLGDKVRDLSVSKIVFWNHGALTIDSDDLVPADRLRLETKGKGRILSTKLISTNNKASQPLLSASPEKDQAFLQFEYLDRGQGFVIQVIHEGTSSNDLDLKGAIKGVTRIRKIDLNEFINKTKTGRRKQLLGQYAGLISLWVVFPSGCFYMAWGMGGYLGGLGALFFSAAGLFMIAVGIMAEDKLSLEDKFLLGLKLSTPTLDNLRLRPAHGKAPLRLSEPASYNTPPCEAPMPFTIRPFAGNISH